MTHLLCIARFRNNEQGILLATDVAARGIDVQIDHVIHYQFPRDVQTYIHRSGRTARASSAGKGGLWLTCLN